MKKVLKSLLVLVLVLVQVFPMFTVNAQQKDNGSIKEGTKGKITINNAIVGQSYRIYQILELESYSTGKAYSYKVDSNWKEFVKTPEAKEYLHVNEEGYVSWVGEKTDSRVAAFAKLALAYAKANNINAVDSKQATTEEEGVTVTTVTFENLELGYYLVDSSTGALCSLDTTDNEVVIREKNTVPTVDKTVKEENGKYGDKNTADIGDIVNFKTEITVGAGAQNYVLYDKMSDGLTYKSITKVELVSGDTTTELSSSNYEMKSVDNTVYDFIMDFTDELEKTLKENDVIIVYYTAILNEGAVVEGKGNENETYLVYGDGTETNHDYTYTYTFKFNLVKENAQNEQLTGAEFELYAADKTTKINLVKEADGTYRVATEEEIKAEGFTSANIFAGRVIIKGLDEATYYLKEITPPNGYNLLADFVEVIVTANYDDEGVSTTLVSGAENNLVTYAQDKVTVINTTGNELPSTGGMGTVLFLTIGSLMVLGFGVLLVTKLRMAKMAL